MRIAITSLLCGACGPYDVGLWAASPRTIVHSCALPAEANDLVLQCQERIGDIVRRLGEVVLALELCPVEVRGALVVGNAHQDLLRLLRDRAEAIANQLAHADRVDAYPIAAVRVAPR